MSHVGLKKVFIVSLAVFGFSLCAAEVHAHLFHHHGCQSGCGCGGDCGCDFGMGCGCSTCATPMSCCGTYGGRSFGNWGTPAYLGCGWGACCFGGMADSGTERFGEAPAPAPTAAPTEAPMPHNSAVPSHTSVESTFGENGVITIEVPYDAKVTVNGTLTKSTGSQRKFFSTGLVPGSTYEYEVKAEVVREGKIVVETQTVLLTSGEHNRVAFRCNTPGTEGLAATK